MENKSRQQRTHSDLSGIVDWGASVSLDAERSLLGLFLGRADTFDLVGADIAPAQFYEPLHRKIFEMLTASRSKGLTFTRERLGELLSIDPVFKAAGGDRYLDQITTTANVAELEGVDPRELARLVVDLYVRREVIKAAGDIAKAARGDALKTGAELRDMMEARLFAAELRHGEQDTLKSIGAIVVGALAQSQKGGRDLLPTGLAKLDDRIGKCERGDLIFLGARPSMGKSALASCIALNAGLAGIGAIEFNGEMSEGQIARRHLSDMCHRLYDTRGPSYRDIRQGKLDANARAMLEVAQQRMEGLPLFAMRRRGMTLPFIRGAARRQARTWRDQGTELGFLIVDSINNMDAALQGYTNPVQQMTHLTAGLKTIAVELNCVVIALSQLSRKVEERDDKRPTLSDLRESGSLEQDADVVVGVYRDAYYAEREARPKKNDQVMEWQDRRGSKTLEAICLKVKEGAPGTEKLHCDVARNAVRDEEHFGSEANIPGMLDLSNDEVPI